MGRIRAACWAIAVVGIGCSTRPPDGRAPEPAVEVAEPDGGTPPPRVADGGSGLSPGAHVPPIDLAAAEWTDVRTTPRACEVTSPTQVCTLECLCWENPQPHGDTVFSIAAGPRGTYFGVHNGILLWDGVNFVHEPVPTAAYFDVSTAGDDVWAAAGDLLVRFDGREWSTVPLPGERHTTVLATAPGEAWTISHGGGVYRWRDGTWEKMDVPGAWFLDGTSPNDVWIAAPMGVYQFDGIRWRDRTPEDMRILDLGVSEDGVMARLQRQGFMEREVILRWDGEAWTEAALPTADFTLRQSSAWGTRPTASGFEALRKIGEEWHGIPLPEATYYLRIAIAGGTVWAFGEEGYLARLEGDTFVPLTVRPRRLEEVTPGWTDGDALHVEYDGSVVAWDGSTARAFFRGVRSLSRAPDGTLWVANDRAAFHFDGAKELARIPAPTHVMGAIAVTADGTLWSYFPAGIGYHGELFRYATSSGWTEEAPPELDAKYLGAVTAVGPELWVIASGEVFRHADARWTKEVGPPCLAAGSCAAEGLAATGLNDVWLRTSAGVFRFDGRAWTQISSKGHVTLSGRGEAWLQWFGAKPGQPDTAYWDGTRWHALRVPHGARLSVAGGRLSAFLPTMSGPSATRLEFRPAETP